MEDINAHTRAAFPSFRKKEMHPLNNGITISKTGIIICQSFFTTEAHRVKNPEAHS
jgi:hypothetical protein